MPSDPTGQEHLTPVKIRDTSATERAGFRRCRRQWFLTVVHRLDRQEGNVNFFIGTLYHRGLQVYYEAIQRGASHDEAEEEAFDAYQAAYDEEIAVIRKQLGFAWQIAEPLWKESGQLGLDMLQNYLDAEEQNPLLDEIISVEVRVSVPIRSRKGRRIGWLSVQTDLVGRKDGELKAIDHKTRSRAVNMSHVDIDDQLTAEAFAVAHTVGEWPDKVMLNVAYKKAPHPPKQIKGTKAQPVKLSKDRTQGTTYTLYRQEIERLGLDKGDYVDILAYLKDLDDRGENVFFEREETVRTPGQMLAFERDLYWEFSDMRRVAANPEQAYPSPSEMNCSSCPVRIICTTIQDDGDVSAIIQAGFVIADPRR